MERDGSGKPTGLVGPYGQHTQLNVDGNRFLSRVVNPAGEATFMSNTTDGLLSTITGPLNDIYKVTYDSKGRAVQTQDADGDKFQLSQSEASSAVTATSQSDTGNIETRKLRKLDLLTNGDTLIQRVYADGTVDLLLSARSGGEAITNSDGSIVTYKTTADPRFSQGTEVPTTVTTTLPGGLQSTITVSRLARLAIAGDPTSLLASTNFLVLNGQTNATTYTTASHTLAETSAEGREHISVLDDQGRVTRIQNSVFSPLETVYDSAGRVVAVINQSSMTPRRTDFSYDALGRLSAMVDPIGRTNYYIYYAANRPVRAISPGGATLAVNYDAGSRATNLVTPNGAAHAFIYNSIGLLSAYVPPVVNGGDDSVRYGYDTNNRLTEVNLSGTRTINFALSPDGRINQISGSSAGTLDFRYDANSGLMTNVALSTGEALSFLYQGPFVTNIAWSGGISGTVGVQLNESLSVRQQTVNGGFGIDYTYDRDGLLTRAGDMAISSDPASGFLSSTALAAVTNTWQYNEFAEPTNFVAAFDGQPFTNSFDYRYDLAGRLIEVRKNGAPFSEYAYDDNGNRLSKTDRNGTATAKYDAQDRLIQYGSSTFSYSASGDLTNRSGARSLMATYDGPGNLIRVTVGNGDVIEYVIDAEQRRIGKKKNHQLTRSFLYQDDLKPVAELDSNNNVISRFVYATSVNAPDYMFRDRKTYALIRDHLGSIRLAVDAQTGTVAQRLEYDEFGEVTQDTSPGFQPFGFSGGLYDPDTGLVRFGARDYDPETGRWTSKDPARFAGRSVNLFAYVSNDPVNLVDLSGAAEQPAYYIYSAGYGVHLPFLPAGFGRSYGFIIDRYGRYYTFKTTAGGRVAGLGASAAAGYLPRKKGNRNAPTRIDCLTS